MPLKELTSPFGEIHGASLDAGPDPWASQLLLRFVWLQGPLDFLQA